MGKKPSSIAPPPKKKPAAADRWRTLIVDDHSVFRSGLRELLETEPGITVCGEAADVKEALEAVTKLRPQFVTVDISLATGNGLHLVERIRKFDPTIMVLVLSMYDEGVYADRAITAGAVGYVCKQASNEDILDAIRTIRRGGVYLSQTVMQRLRRRNAGELSPISDISEESRLSARELEILGLIGQVQNTHEISEKLHVSVSTVETYRERIKHKLGLSSGAELTRHAILWVLHHA